MTTINNEKVLRELLNKQLKNIDMYKKLQFNDIKRISKYLKDSIFGDKCSIWGGYITNDNDEGKGTYINFYFKEKKVALHRLLYTNFVGELGDTEYLKFCCPNKGKCCNINHITKHEYNEKTEKCKQTRIKNRELRDEKNKFENKAVTNKKSKKTKIDPNLSPKDSEYTLDFE
jgi:hypothetical protein